MALRTIMLGVKLTELKRELEAKRDKATEIEERSAALKTREAELEEAIREASTDEEKAAVEIAVTEHEEAEAAIEKEKQENAEESADLESRINEIEKEIAAREEKQELSTKPQETAPQEREAEIKMEKRTSFENMTLEQRSAFFEREDVKNYIDQIRALGKGQTRGVTGANLTIPVVMLEMVREHIENYSKLITKVNKKTIKGEGRQNIAGAIPEAVWTEMCANLNEADIHFYQQEVDGYMVGAYIAVCNATLEDSDLALGTEIFTSLSQGIGLALDKAILYGTGTKMPRGIVPRLAETARPSGYNTNDRSWTDLHTSNIISIASSSKAQALYQEIIIASGAVSDKYATKDLVWVMNKKTKNYLTAQALTINAAGAIVSGQGNEMPVAGGEIITLNFIPDNVIIVGYMENYLLAERAGIALDKSTEVKFIQNQTVFKATARYDGHPTIPEAFAAIGINGTTPTATMTFAADTANS